MLSATTCPTAGKVKNGTGYTKVMGEVRKFLFVWSVVGFGLPLTAQDVSSWFPLTVGNRWTYAHETLDGTTRAPRIMRWQTEETITGMLALAEGTVVFRYVNVQGETPGSWLSRYGQSHYLIRNSCLYFLDPKYSWNETERQLNPDYRERLLRGGELPAVCFPLSTGMKFGPTVGILPSKVVGTGAGSGFTPPSVSEQAFRIEVHLFDADTTRLWFEKGVGFTGLWDWHKGSYSEYRVKLVKFEPASATRPHSSSGGPDER